MYLNIKYAAKVENLYGQSAFSQNVAKNIESIRKDLITLPGYSTTTEITTNNIYWNTWMNTWTELYGSYGSKSKSKLYFVYSAGVGKMLTNNHVYFNVYFMVYLVKIATFLYIEY